MSVVKDEYQGLPPKGEKLSDVVVLAQAWKKSHAYIRRHNWYADVLALDASAINLESRLEKWAQKVGEADFEPKSLRLVPAPKNARWSFRSTDDQRPKPAFENWAPNIQTEDDASVGTLATSHSELRLRPLAHMLIRDQTLATTVMMCLAEAVESAQGDTTGKGSPPISRTLTRRPIEAIRSVHVRAKEVQCRVQTRCG